VCAPCFVKVQVMDLEMFRVNDGKFHGPLTWNGK